jgi:two-component system phosphate regulon sensor histidine kinase PhoR
LKSQKHRTLIALASLVLLGSIVVQAWWIYRGYEQQKGTLKSQMSLALSQAVNEVNTQEEIAFLARVDAEQAKAHEMALARQEAELARLQTELDEEAMVYERIVYVESSNEHSKTDVVSVSNSSQVSVMSSDDLDPHEIDSLIALARIQPSGPVNEGKSGANVSVIVKNVDGAFSTEMKWDTDDSALIQVLKIQKEGRLEALIEKIEQENIFAHERLQHDLDTVLLREALRTSFSNFGLDQPFEFAVSSKDSLRVKPIASNHFLENETEMTVETSLFPFDLITKDAMLKVQLADSFSTIMSQLWGMIAVSVIFSLSMIAIFILTINRLLSQTRLSQLKTDFINNMSHELKTPLATISLAADTIMLDSISKEKVTEFAKTIKKEHVRIHDHIDRVLNMAQAEKGRLEMEKEPIEIEPFVTSIFSDLSLILKEKKAEVIIDVADQLPALPADLFHLRAALTNLVDNALKYSNDHPEIKFIARSVQNQIEISITDNGIGMSEEQIRLAFEPFYRVETGNLQKTKGFGLGLSYVKMVMEKHGGTVRLQSVPNEGTTVTLIFST